MVCFWRRRVHDKSATEYGAGWFAFRGGEAALYVKNSVDLQWARSGEKRYQHMLVNNAENPVRFVGSGRVFSRCGIWPKDIAGFGKILTGCGIWPKGSARFGIWENVDGMRDLTKRQGGIRENIDGMRDLTKRQCGIRENVDRCAIWLLAGKRNLPKGTDADWERKWCSGWRWQKFGMCYFRENGAEIRDQESPFPDPSLSDRRVVKTYRHALFVV